MLLLTILDILLIVVGGVGMGYQALCISPNRSSSRRPQWTNATPC